MRDLLHHRRPGIVVAVQRREALGQWGVKEPAVPLEARGSPVANFHAGDALVCGQQVAQGGPMRVVYIARE